MATTPRVLLIGGGLVGALCALRLRDAGADVTVFDRALPGREATYAAAGILAAQSEARRADDLFALGLASRALHESLSHELIQRLGRDGQWRRAGVMELALTDARLDALYERTRWQRDLGLRVQRLGAEELFAREPSLRKDLAGAVLFEDDAVVDPRALHEAVMALAEREGVRVMREVEVTSLCVRDGRVRGVEMAGGVIEGERVVLCAGARSGAVARSEMPAETVIPARGQMVELTCERPLVSAVLFTDEGYLVPRADGRVLSGSTMEFAGFDASVTADGVQSLLRRAIETVPSLAGAVFSSAWAGLRPYTRDGRPVLGRAAVDGLIVATGHHRSGILLAPITAEVVRDLVMRGETSHPIASLSPLRTEKDA